VIPRNKSAFVFALLSLGLAAASFADRASPYGTSLHRYLWLGWTASAAAWLYRAYRRAPKQSL